VIQPGAKVPIAWVRLAGNRAYASGHGPLAPDGTIAPPLGRVGAEVTLEQAQCSARLALLAVLGSLQRSLGDLDRVGAWVSISSFVRVAPGFTETPAVLNSASDLLQELYGPKAATHARTTIGVADLPFGVPVVVAAEVELA
jgi:enamine deaminase RidA (YjgF/YER057c/UK114 family)